MEGALEGEVWKEVQETFRKQNKVLIFQTNILEPIIFGFAWRTVPSVNVTSVTLTSLCCLFIPPQEFCHVPSFARSLEKSGTSQFMTDQAENVWELQGCPSPFFCYSLMTSYYCCQSISVEHFTFWG